jgi:hypothetical protein
VYILRYKKNIYIYILRYKKYIYIYILRYKKKYIYIFLGTNIYIYILRYKKYWEAFPPCRHPSYGYILEEAWKGSTGSR